MAELLPRSLNCELESELAANCFVLVATLQRYVCASVCKPELSVVYGAHSSLDDCLWLKKVAPQCLLGASEPSKAETSQGRRTRWETMATAFLL